MQIRQFMIAATPVLGVILMAFLYFTSVNRDGAARWAEVEARLISENISMDLSDFRVTDLPSPETNFAETPLIRSCFDFKIRDEEIFYSDPETHERFTRMKLPEIALRAYPISSWATGKATKLDIILEGVMESGEFKVPKDGTDSERILAAWSVFDSDINELVAATNRPHAKIKKAKYPDTFLELTSEATPWRNDLRSQVNFQSVLATVHLNAGQPDNALASVVILNRLGDLYGSSSKLIDLYLKNHIQGSIHTIIWEGLELGVWTDANFEAIRETLDRQDLFEQAEAALNVELIISGIIVCDHQKDKNFFSQRGLGFEMPPSDYLDYANFFPNGFWDHNKANFCEALLDRTILPIRNKRFTGLSFPAIEEKPKTMWIYLLQSLFNDATRIAKSEAYRRIVMTSCAVERYRIENNALPASLDLLVPDYLKSIPADIMAPSNPIQYIVDSDGYKLYSVGLNRTDDNGEVVWKKHSNRRRNQEEGDWVWGNPMPKPPPKSH